MQPGPSFPRDGSGIEFMAQYCTQADIQGEIQLSDLISLTDDSNTGNVDSAVLAQIITNASNFIDGQISNIYDLPFAVVPSAINSMCVIIVCYRLYRRREVPDEKNKYFEDYDAVRKRLEKIGNGDAHLDLNVPRNFAQVAISGQGTVFGGMGSNCLARTL